MATVFDRSLEQRREALQKANKVRIERAELKRELRERRLRLADVLCDPPEFVETMRVFDLLVATPKVGQAKALKALRVAVVSPSRPVGRLSSRERADLLRLVA